MSFAKPSLGQTYDGIRAGWIWRAASTMPFFTVCPSPPAIQSGVWQLQIETQLWTRPVEKDDRNL